MGSRKRSAMAREKKAFISQLDDGWGTACEGGNASDSIDSLFAREDKRREQLERERDAAHRYQACERKNRYSSRAEAEDVRAACAERGRRGLHIYHCPYCNGWHLTSKPQR